LANATRQRTRGFQCLDGCWIGGVLVNVEDPWHGIARCFEGFNQEVFCRRRIAFRSQTRLSNGAGEGMNNKIKSNSHRSFGFRTAGNFIVAIYHCCARLPLPAERKLHSLDSSLFLGPGLASKVARGISA
jgi:Transposase